MRREVEEVLGLERVGRGERDEHLELEEVEED